MVTVFLNGLGVVTPALATGAIALSTAAVSPAAVLLPATGPSSALPTFTLAGAVSGIAQVQVQAGATSSVVNLYLGASSVRGPGIVIWSGQPSRSVQEQLKISPGADIPLSRIRKRRTADF
jgi:hypothetical protein